MGKTSSKVSVGSRTKRIITVQGGIKVDLGNNPLVYGDNDPNISNDARKAVEDFENKRPNSKIEFGVVIDNNNGGMIGKERRGSNGSVNISIVDIDRKNAIFSHLHPRGDANNQALGGTFSFKDLRNFAIFDVGTYRAKAAEGTYSISKKWSIKV